MRKSYLQPIILHYFDEDRDGLLSHEERMLAEERESRFAMRRSDYLQLPEPERERIEELVSARIIEDNLVSSEANRARVRHIPIERRPFVF